MATNLDLDPGLLGRAMAASGAKTRRAVAAQAIEEFTARRASLVEEELFDRLDGTRASATRPVR